MFGRTVLETGSKMQASKPRSSLYRRTKRPLRARKPSHPTVAEGWLPRLLNWIHGGISRKRPPVKLAQEKSFLDPPIPFG